jgi:hypothetical protein
MRQPREKLLPTPIAAKVKPPFKKTELEKAAETLNGLTMKAVYIGEGKDGFDGKPWTHDKWTCVFSRNGQSVSFDYSTGTGHRTKVRFSEWNYENEVRPTVPGMADVLNCLIMDADAVGMSFADWCDNFGYDTDSRKAERTYFACQETGEKLRKVLTREEIETLRGLEH